MQIMPLELVVNSIKKPGTRGWLSRLLSFCIFDYEFIDTVGVFTLRCKFIAILKQVLEDEVVFCISKTKVIFLLSHTKINALFTTSIAQLLMLFIFWIHFIWSGAFSCSVTPSFSVYCFTSREKSCGLVPLYRQGGNGVCRKWADYNTKLCDGTLSSLTCVVSTLRYNWFLLPLVKLDYTKEILSSFFENSRR